MDTPHIHDVKKIADDALEMSRKANGKIDSHEEICALRYTGFNNSVVDIKKDIQILSTRMWVAAGSTIAVTVTGSMGLVIFLLQRG